MPGPATNQSKRNSDLIIGIVLAFISGFGTNFVSNYLTYSKQVDKLTSEQQQNTEALRRFADRQDDRDAKVNDLNTRVSVLEAKSNGSTVKRSN